MTPTEAVEFVMWRQGREDEPTWEQVAKLFRLSRASAYRWLKAYRNYMGQERSLNRLASGRWVGVNHDRRAA
jgi:hypothetical protein